MSITDNEDKGKQPLMGDILALVSAVAYGVYTVYLRKATDGKNVSMAMMLGKLPLFLSHLIKGLWVYLMQFLFGHSS